jgi:hypothetical protein
MSRKKVTKRNGTVLRLSQQYGTVQNAGEKVVGRTMTTGRAFR